jgi:hypothetical protein
MPQGLVAEKLRVSFLENVLGRETRVRANSVSGVVQHARVKVWLAWLQDDTRRHIFFLVGFHSVMMSGPHPDPTPLTHSQHQPVHEMACGACQPHYLSDQHTTAIE